MMCGAKRFIVEMEKDGEIKWECVTARTPASARKFIRNKFGDNTKILSAREETNTQKPPI